MNNAGSTSQIDVDALRVGMFIHLDVGWMSHPFPLSSFRLGSDEQIGIIRSLGIKRLRWSPEQSVSDEAVAKTAVASVETAEAAAHRERRAAAMADRAALVQCERQFAQATRESREIAETVRSNPELAHERVHALSQTIIAKLSGEQDMCIRLLTDAAGDKASAHAVNVALISLLMGRSFGLGQVDMLDLCVGALLHDIGKMDVPAPMRHREENFSISETKLYEEHVTHGVTQALKMGLSMGATVVIAQHHEHADGSGFPMKLNTDRMTPMSRIVALVDRYDNLCNPPHAGKGVTPHEALSLLFAQGKDKYDTAILGSFIKMMGVYPPGSLVQLTDDRFATVVGVNSSRPLKPRVTVHEPKAPLDEMHIVDLERSPHLGIRRSVHPSSLPRATQDVLTPRSRVAYFFEPLREEVSA